jgi:hypothetical protein
MDKKIDSDTVTKFLYRVIEIEEKYAFVKKGQDSLRREELLTALDKFCQ